MGPAKITGTPGTRARSRKGDPWNSVCTHACSHTSATLASRVHGRGAPLAPGGGEDVHQGVCAWTRAGAARAR